MSEKPKQKILIIEDEALVARELKSRLTQMGCEVVGIAYGSEGIELARETRPDLLLTDIHLKDGEDGIEMAQRIRAERDVPVVFLTAYSDEDTVARAKAITPYGYIIKPVDNRELQIAIDMALYKFAIEKELRETQQLLQTALTCIGSALVFVDAQGAITDLNTDAEDILATRRVDARGQPWAEVFEGIGASIQHKINVAFASSEVTKLAPFISGSPLGRPRLLDGIVGPMESGGVLILRSLSEISDPIELMPTADEMLSRVGADRLIPSESSMCQLLIAQSPPADPERIEAISALLNQQLRATDLVSVYGGAYLAVSMPYTSVEAGRLIANSVLKRLKTVYQDQGFEFSIGLSHSSPGDQQPFELFRRAGWGLRVAEESGGGRVIVWNDEVDLPAAISEQDKQREYNNLVLLWNVLNVVAKAPGIVEASEKLCGHLLHSFELVKVAVLSLENEFVEAIAGAVHELPEFSGIPDLNLSQRDFENIQRLLARPASHLEDGSHHFFMLAEEKLLFLETRVALAAAELDFIKTLVTYFGAGLARFVLPETAEEPGHGDGSMIYRSARMTAVMESIKLVADTDATVLVAGESGTGKEVVARMIHQSSQRRDKSFIIVDCGAVVGSLIESELFGHEKGAFTGADKQFSGRLKEADGGTVLLDEIGELPLDVQVKLLRFVQDREIAAVGSSRYETVDTRVVAATNRDLKMLVEQGRFREDLYYRLNVFAIDTPPLRERSDDIMLLADHYLQVYTKQYGKKVSGFSTEAEQALLQYGWPGNIRELTNVINRAVILCKDSRLGTIHIGLFPDAGSSLAGGLSAAPAKPQLTDWIEKLIESCLAAGEYPPLGEWLEEDLIHAALRMNLNVQNRAALALGIPESTLRRKVARIRKEQGEGVPIRPESWEGVQSLLEEVILHCQGEGIMVFELVNKWLVQELERRPINRKQAAAVLGVSLPTYRRLVAESP